MILDEAHQYFKTRISKGYVNEPVNFGGHYKLIYWGCGSPCQIGVIVDIITGIIYNIPGSAWGYYFRLDSRLLVVNPPREDGLVTEGATTTPHLFE